MEFDNTSTVTPLAPSSLFFCTLCDKPFTKESQYKRHIAYCRKSQGRTRPRSCRTCGQSKIKCNSRNPCHQCVRKGIVCVYDQPPSRRVRDDAGCKGPGEGVASATVDPDPVRANAMVVETEATQPGPGAEELEERLGFGLVDDDMFGGFDEGENTRLGAFPELSQSQYSFSRDGARDTISNGMYSGSSSSMTMTAATTTPPDASSFMSLLHDTFNNTIAGDIDFLLDDSNYYSVKELQLPAFSPISPPPTILNPALCLSQPSLSTISTATTTSPSSDIVHFTKNKVKTAIQQTHATMIIDMIRAYPRMMMRRETLPPFTHAYSPISRSPDPNNQSALPKHLTNCMGIAQLFAVCNTDTRPFVWATIRSEMRGFRDRLRDFDKWDAFSALQATLFYLILRAVEELPQEAKDDLEMILIYKEVCDRVIELTYHFRETSGDENPNLPLQWKDWILAESNRRVACVWFLLGLIFHVRTNVPCYITDHFRELPLPCSKMEWEAKTEAQWRTEYQNAVSARNASHGGALKTFGDLIDAHQRVPGVERDERLDVWNAGIDHLGMLLNLAVYMI